MFTYPQVGEHGCARLDTGFLALSKIGRVAVRWSRPLEGTPKTVTIAKEADGWYALLLSCADVPTQPLPATGRETGIAVGLKVFLSTADGLVVENPRHHRQAAKRIAKAGRRVSRRKQGSKRRGKAGRREGGKAGRREGGGAARQSVSGGEAPARRLPPQDRASLAQAIRHDLSRSITIYLEDLRGATMVRKRQLAMSISDAGWAQFRSILDAKAACAGRRVIAVPAHYTSQDCSGCGMRVAKSLRVGDRRPRLSRLWAGHGPR